MYGQNSVRDLFCNEPVIINFFNRRIRKKFLWNAERWKNVPAISHDRKISQIFKILKISKILKIFKIFKILKIFKIFKILKIFKIFKIFLDSSVLFTAVPFQIGTYLMRNLNLEFFIKIWWFGFNYVIFDLIVVKANWNVQLCYLLPFPMKKE